MARAFICGLAGASLATEEISFLREARPWGVILFRRNVGVARAATRADRSAA